MYLVIGEKPSVSQTLAKVLGAGKRQDGYLSGADCIVSWCLGHLAEYVSPEVYDSRYEKWEFSQLPILPKQLVEKTHISLILYTLLISFHFFNRFHV